jgi:hypothetical protein
MHPVFEIDDDCRNDSADGKKRADNPSDLTISSMAARVKEWSSTIEMSGISVHG